MVWRLNQNAFCNCVGVHRDTLRPNDLWPWVGRRSRNTRSKPNKSHQDSPNQPVNSNDFVCSSDREYIHIDGLLGRSRAVKSGGWWTFLLECVSPHSPPPIFIQNITYFETLLQNLLIYRILTSAIWWVLVITFSTMTMKCQYHVCFSS